MQFVTDQSIDQLGLTPSGALLVLKRFVDYWVELEDFCQANGKNITVSKIGLPKNYNDAKDFGKRLYQLLVDVPLVTDTSFLMEKVRDTKDIGTR